MCDLVGEIGHYAVRRATERDAAAVRGALASAVAVQSAVLHLGAAAPRGLHKKADALRTSVRKMETLLYELSLVERSGRVREPPRLAPLALSARARLPVAAAGNALMHAGEVARNRRGGSKICSARRCSRAEE